MSWYNFIRHDSSYELKMLYVTDNQVFLSIALQWTLTRSLTTVILSLLSFTYSYCFTGMLFWKLLQLQLLLVNVLQLQQKILSQRLMEKTMTVTLSTSFWWCCLNNFKIMLDRVRFSTTNGEADEFIKPLTQYRAE